MTNDLINKIILGDCLEVMQEIDNESIDLICVDPPYGVLNSRTKWDFIIPLDKMWEQFGRIIKDNGAMVIFSQQPFTTKLIASNYPLFRYDLIYQKPMGTGFLNANRMPLRSHEEICIFYKSLPTYNPQKTEGKPYKLTRRSDTNNYGEVKNLHQETNNESGLRFPKSVLKFAADKEKLHSTQKPLLLMEYLIKTFTNEGQLVLDNCAGSGSTLVAARNTNRKFIGIEKNEEIFQIAQKRLGFI